MNAKEIIEWVKKQKIDSSNNESIYNFVLELQGKIMELDFDLPKGTVPIGYAGSTSIMNGTGIYQTVDYITKGSNGKYGFINDVADNILNYKYFDEHGKSQTLWTSIDSVLPNGYVDIIFKGGKNGDIRSTQCFGDLLCLNDFVSEQYFKHNGSGNVLFILTDTARNDSTVASSAGSYKF